MAQVPRRRNSRQSKAAQARPNDRGYREKLEGLWNDAHPILPSRATALTGKFHRIYGNAELEQEGESPQSECCHRGPLSPSPTWPGLVREAWLRAAKDDDFSLRLKTTWSKCAGNKELIKHIDAITAVRRKFVVAVLICRGTNSQEAVR